MLVLDNEILKETAKTFKMLSDPKRLQLLCLLQQGEYNVSTLVQELTMEQSALSHQLKLLREHHLVATRRVGKSIYYRLDDAHVGDTLTQMLAHTSHTFKTRK